MDADSRPPTRARCRKQRLRRYFGCAPADALDAAPIVTSTLPVPIIPPSTEPLDARLPPPAAVASCCCASGDAPDRLPAAALRAAPTDLLLFCWRLRCWMTGPVLADSPASRPPPARAARRCRAQAASSVATQRHALSQRVASLATRRREQRGLGEEAHRYAERPAPHRLAQRSSPRE